MIRSRYKPGQKIYLSLPHSHPIPARVQHGKWKYKLECEDAVIRLKTQDFPKLAMSLYNLVIQYSHKIDHPYFSIRLGFMNYIELTAKQGYAIDGVTAASFLEDPETLYRALWHDILMQAIYDEKLLPKSIIEESHKVFAIIRPSTKSKFIYHSLNLLHKPWNKLTS